jgi:hypothetical protein
MPSTDRQEAPGGGRPPVSAPPAHAPPGRPRPRRRSSQGPAAEVAAMSTPDPPDPTSATGGGRAGASLSAEDRVWEVETWDAIRSRRNVRSHAEGTIASEDVDRILEAGRRTLGRQPAGLGLRHMHRPRAAHAARQVWRSAGPVAGSAATIALVAPIPTMPARRRPRDAVEPCLPDPVSFHPAARAGSPR